MAADSLVRSKACAAQVGYERCVAVAEHVREEWSGRAGDDIPPFPPERAASGWRPCRVLAGVLVYS